MKRRVVRKEAKADCKRDVYSMEERLVNVVKKSTCCVTTVIAILVWNTCFEYCK